MNQNIALSERLAAFMTPFVSTDFYDEEEVQNLIKLIESNENEQELRTICRSLFDSDWIFMPLELASALTQRLIRVSSDQDAAKLLRGKWLHLFGMEYENEEEGIKLLQESEEGRVILQQQTAKLFPRE